MAIKLKVIKEPFELKGTKIRINDCTYLIIKEEIKSKINYLVIWLLNDKLPLSNILEEGETSGNIAWYDVSAYENGDYGTDAKGNPFINNSESKQDGYAMNYILRNCPKLCK